MRAMDADSNLDELQQGAMMAHAFLLDVHDMRKEWPGAVEEVVWGFEEADKLQITDPESWVQS